LDYLKKNTVKHAILLARACQHTQPQSEEEKNARLEGTLSGYQEDSNLRAYLDFLGSLTPEEFAELTALMLLGQDQHRRPEDWHAAVDQARSQPSQDLQRVSKFKLPQFLRYGMERLARHIRLESQKRQDEQKPTIVETDRKIYLAGKLSLAAYEQRYGRVVGLKKLGELLARKGYMESSADHQLFGLPAQGSDEEEFEITLNNITQL